MSDLVGGAAPRSPREAEQLARLKARDLEGFTASLLESIRLYADTEAGRSGMGSPVMAALVYAGIERDIAMLAGAALEAGPSPLCDYTKLQRDLRDAYQSARESGLDAHAAFECALDEAIPGVRGESLPSDAKIAPDGPWYIVEASPGMRRLVAHRETSDSVGWMKTLEQAEAVRDALNRIAPCDSGNAVGRVGGEEP